MKKIVKIDHQKEYDTAKKAIEDLTAKVGGGQELSDIDGSIDNLKTVINVLLERSAPKPKKRRDGSGRQKKKDGIDSKIRKDFNRLPSQRFPDLEVQEKIVKSVDAPKCECCGEQMSESGLYKTSEKLETVPKTYHIVRHKRVIYNCGACHGSMANAPSIPSISRNSNYGDSVVIDASLSKYCDLIPMERYCHMAERSGVPGLPPNSMIALTHTLATFLDPVYESLKQQVMEAQIILADETPHKMLEGSETPNWYLWGFSSYKACIFEAKDTRSGDVPIAFLKDSDCSFLVTDGYSGYKRAIAELKKDSKDITEVYCNAHAYRYFRDATGIWKEETEFFLELYGKINELERQAKDTTEKNVARVKMKAHFEAIKDECERTKEDIMPNSALEKAVNYFSNHYEGLTRCTDNIDLPLDNDSSERLLRSSVVGRKTWYGTHSKKGARTGSILFSIVESCKINQINPRNYFPWVIAQIHQKKSPLTPYEYSKLDSG